MNIPVLYRYHEYVKESDTWDDGYFDDISAKVSRTIDCIKCRYRHKSSGKYQFELQLNESIG